MFRFSVYAAGIAAVLAAWAVPPAQAGALHVGPLRIELTPEKPVATLDVRNDNPDAITVQLERMSWSEPDGEDVYTPTQDFIATPIVFPLATGASQVVRLALREGAEKRVGAYRLYVREVPGSGAGKAGAVVVALRIGVPVFVAPTGATAKLDWKLQRQPSGEFTLTAHNVGAKFVRILQLTARGANGDVDLMRSTDPVYVLADGKRYWPIKASKGLSAGQPFQLMAKTETATFNETLTLPN